MRFAVLASALALVLTGCITSADTVGPAEQANQAAAVVVASQDPPADDKLNAVAWYQTSAERDLVFRIVYRAASEKLQAALADKTWDALPKEDRVTPVKGLAPAIIVDVDETILDHAPSSARQIVERADFDEAQWGAWVEERKAKALPGAAAFLNSAAKQGVTVFYISNRDASLAEATIANIRAAGFPIARDEQFLGLGTVVDGCEQEGSEKSCRRQLVGRTHRVLMQFGDQVGDLVQIVANTPEGRRAAVAPYEAWIGERWFVLPNPMYGSWEPALFDNDWRQPAGDRRAKKEAALDLAR
jgi:5'-nucleotidase (lipoprotein e(P4) family)